MSFYRTCRNCILEKLSCDRRASVAEKIKGAGLTSVTFRCETRRPLYRPGQRVEVSWTVPDMDGEYGLEATLERWPATVANESKKGFVIVVDDVDSDYGTPARGYIKSDSLYCNVSAVKLRPLDEPDRAACSYCGSVANADGSVTGCWGHDSSVAAKDCLAREAPRKELGALICAS